MRSEVGRMKSSVHGTEKQRLREQVHKTEII